MHLQRLHIINYKNYEEAEIALCEGINCFVGPNGSGKTNLLDAVYYQSMCRSYLNPVDRQNIRFEQAFFMIHGDWLKDGRQIRISCSLKQGQKKLIKRNRQEYERLADHIGEFPVVMISPYDTDLISEGSEHRRKWMDGIIAQTDRNFLDVLQRYTKVLAQRNALLKNMAVHRLFDRESIEVWNVQLVETGKRIHEGRKLFIEEFIPVFQKHYERLSASREQVSLSYRSQLNEADFNDLLLAYEHKDAHTQFSNAGIHRDDLVFEIGGHPIRRFGSQGQQKTYLIALKLAQYEWLNTKLNMRPILLLDDVFDKLDNERVTTLIKLVSDDFFGQVLLTDTDMSRVLSILAGENLDAEIFEVRADGVNKLKIAMTNG